MSVADWPIGKVPSMMPVPVRLPTMWDPAGTPEFAIATGSLAGQVRCSTGVSVTVAPVTGQRLLLVTVVLPQTELFALGECWLKCVFIAWLDSSKILDQLQHQPCQLFILF